MSAGVLSVGRPKSPGRRNDVAVKIDARVAWQVKFIAMSRGITMAEYLSEVVAPVAAKDYAKAKADFPDEPPAEPKPKSKRPR